MGRGEWRNRERIGNGEREGTVRLSVQTSPPAPSPMPISIPQPPKGADGRPLSHSFPLFPALSLPPHPTAWARACACDPPDACVRMHAVRYGYGYADSHVYHVALVPDSLPDGCLGVCPHVYRWMCPGTCLGVPPWVCLPAYPPRYPTVCPHGYPGVCSHRPFPGVGLQAKENSGGRKERTKEKVG